VEFYLGRVMPTRPRQWKTSRCLPVQHTFCWRHR